jgi:hypothetical protein
MATPKGQPPMRALPKLAKPALRALARAGITRLDQLAGRREADLLALHGLGPSALAALRAALAARGQTFAAPARAPR